MKRLFSLILILITSSIEAQVSVDKLKFPKLDKLPDSFQQSVDRQIKDYHRLFKKDSSTTNHYTVPFMLEKIDSDSNYQYIFLAEFWTAFHYQDMIPELIKRITNKTEVGLVNSADLIIWERVIAKQMKSWGHGGVSKDDLFTVAGRANRILTQVTGQNFGNVSMYSTQDQLTTLQKSWMNWLKELN